MSGARSSECLLCSFSRLSRSNRSARRQFHASSIHQNRKPRFPSIKAPEKSKSKHPLAYLTDRGGQFFSKDGTLPQNYSPEQQAAIEAAKKFGTLKHIQESRGSMRTGGWKMNYFDDLTKVDPVIDKAVQAPWTNIDDNSRLKDEDDLLDDFLEQAMKDSEVETWVDDDGVEHMIPKIENDEWQDFDKNLRLTTGREEAERQPRSALAPDIPNMSEVKKSTKDKFKSMTDDDGESERATSSQRALDPRLITLMQATGYAQRAITQLRVKTLVIHRISNQTRLGKIHRMYALSIAGNQNGMIGIGEAKAVDTPDAMVQSQYRAIRSMQPILRYEDRTIFGSLQTKLSATELELYPLPPGMLSFGR